MSKIKYFWCGWNEPDSIPDEHVITSWPDGMKGWHSGSGHDYQTWVGAIFASSPEEAEATILSCYGPSQNLIQMRWEPELREGIRVGDRFKGLEKWLQGNCDKVIKTVDPDRYVIRTGKESWALYPFSEDICSILKTAEINNLSAKDVLYEMKFIDVSIVIDPGQGWGVDWRHGRDVTENLLRLMGTI